MKTGLLFFVLAGMLFFLACRHGAPAVSFAGRLPRLFGGGFYSAGYLTFLGILRIGLYRVREVTDPELIARRVMRDRLRRRGK